MKRVAVIATVATLLSLAASVAAWGPASHYYFTCSAAGVPLEQCLTAVPDLLSGTEMPDAFGFTALLQPLGAGDIPCANWQYLGLHSPLLAGYLYKHSPNFTTPDFNATAFAIGYGMHVTADASGFYNHGYLGYGWGRRGPQPLINNTANWQGLWPFMAAVDAHLFREHFAPIAGAALPTKGVPSTSAATAAFIADVIATVNAINASAPPVFPPITAATVQGCAAAWQSMLAEESVRAMATPPEVSGFELAYHDRFGAVNATEAAQHLALASRCAVFAAVSWHEAIRRPDVDPAKALDVTLAAIEAAYAAGKCTPSSKTGAPGNQNNDAAQQHTLPRRR